LKTPDSSLLPRDWQTAVQSGESARIEEGRILTRDGVKKRNIIQALTREKGGNPLK